jgi:hypothetical protein
MGYLRESSSFTRPANTTAYAAGDLIANDATAGGGGVVVPRVSLYRAGTAIEIIGGLLKKSGASVTNTNMDVHIFSGGVPVPTAGDNEAFNATQVFASNGQDLYRGTLTFVKTNARVMSDGYVCYGLPKISGQPSIMIGASPAELHIAWLLEALEAYTPASAETFQFMPLWRPVVDDPSV